MASTRTTKKNKEASSPNGAPPSRNPGGPLPEPVPNHPLASVIGSLNDIPNDAWERFMDEVRSARGRWDLEHPVEEDEEVAA